MRCALLLVACAGCVDATVEPWQLDHDRIVAVRSSPSHIAPGETAFLDALIAHAGGPTTDEPPRGATAVNAPAGLFAAVHFNLDHWEINGPDESQLAQARGELGLADGAPVPLEVTLQFAGPLYATKLVWLGDHVDNPELPATNIVEPVEVGIAGFVPLLIEAQAGAHVRWLASCGQLEAANEPRASLRGDGACDGELVVVVQDAAGGVVWHVWPLHVR